MTLGVLFHSQLWCVGPKFWFGPVKILGEAGLKEEIPWRSGKRLTAGAAVAVGWEGTESSQAQCSSPGRDGPKSSWAQCSSPGREGTESS